MELKKNRDLTTGDVARIAGVAPGTVHGWCDRGLLRNYRIPGSRYRRIKADDLAIFMERKGMDVPVELSEKCLKDRANGRHSKGFDQLVLDLKDEYKDSPFFRIILEDMVRDIDDVSSVLKHLKGSRIIDERILSFAKKIWITFGSTDSGKHQSSAFGNIPKKTGTIKSDQDLSTGDVSLLCGISRHIIKRLCDTGGLKHYRTPGSNFRKIKPADLIDFLIKEGLEVPEELQVLNKE